MPRRNAKPPEPLQRCPTPGCTNYKMRGRGQCGPCTSSKIETPAKHIEADLDADAHSSMELEIETRKRTLRFMLGGSF